MARQVILQESFDSMDGTTVAQKPVWQVETGGFSNGGTLATAGNLVFQGLADGYFHARIRQMKAGTFGISMPASS